MRAPDQQPSSESSSGLITEPSATLKPGASGATLISEEYRKQQLELHEKGNYGVMGGQYGPLVTEIINKLEVTHVLDYGCGSNLSLYRAVNPAHKITYQAYDPGTEEFAEAPVPAQMVCCIDVLEHIEPVYLNNVLDHLCSLTEVLAFITIHTGPASKTLSDGRNAHLTQEPLEWWLPKLWDRWDIHTVQVTGEHAFHCILYAKPRLEDQEGKKLV